MFSSTFWRGPLFSSTFTALSLPLAALPRSRGEARRERRGERGESKSVIAEHSIRHSCYVTLCISIRFTKWKALSSATEGIGLPPYSPPAMLRSFRISLTGQCCSPCHWPVLCHPSLSPEITEPMATSWPTGVLNSFESIALICENRNVMGLESFSLPSWWQDPIDCAQGPTCRCRQAHLC